MIINGDVFASIATDQHPVYECFAPLTAAVWRERIGFTPLVTLVGYEEEWLARPRSRFVMDELRTMDIRPIFVRVPEGYRSANVAQIARMYAPLELNPEQVAITADIDMWPIDRDWFCRHLPNPSTVTTYYANFPSRFPMCYVAANSDTWFAMHGLDRRNHWGEVESATTAHMLQHLSPETSPPDAWQHDEEYLTARIHSLGPSRLNSVIRPSGDPFPDRIDRIVWPHEIALGGKKDAHLLRPAFSPSNWRQLRQLLGKLCPNLVSWADAYIDRYNKLYEEVSR